MGSPSDTSPEARAVFEKIHRAMPHWRKWELLGDLYRLGRSLHAAGARLRNPEATGRQILDDWFAVNFRTRHESVDRGELNVVSPVEFGGTIEKVIEVLDRLKIEYALGGSLASSIHGVSRNTIDADLTVEPFPGNEAAFVASFGPDFYVSLDAVRTAVRQRSSFNLIQTTSGFKVDLFVRKDRPFEISAMRRRQSFTPSGPDSRPISIVTAEDIILFKLEWYRLGQEISERQWSDVQNVLRVQGDRLDRDYLDTWAAQLGVADLLARASVEAGG